MSKNDVNEVVQHAGPMPVEDRITELRQLEQQDKANRVKAAEAEISEVLKRHRVIVLVGLRSPHNGFVPVTDLHPGWAVLLDLIPQEDLRE